MRWKVQLEGREKGLEELSKSFDGSPRIFEGDDAYYLWYPGFEQLDEASRVQDIAKNIVRTIRNLGELESLHVRGLDVQDSVVEIQEDGTEKIIETVTPAKAKFSIDVARPSFENGEEPSSKVESIFEFTQLAQRDSTVQDLIELRDKGDYWVNLYRIMEFIQDNIEGEDNTVERGWWSASEKSLFKHTANSPDAIDHEARHGKRIDSPSDPMEHRKAKSLIDDLTTAWLNHRKELLDPSEDRD